MCVKVRGQLGGLWSMNVLTKIEVQAWVCVHGGAKKVCVYLPELLLSPEVVCL